MSRNKNQECPCCPLCSRHCSLTSPHCRKGERYARSQQKETAKKPSPPKKPASVSIDDTLLMQLRLCSQNLRRQYRDGGSRYRIMSILLERGKISQQELKEILEVKSGSLSELLAKLEKKGLIRRRKNDADKRNRDIVLTEAGRAWLNDHSERDDLIAHQMFADLSGEDKSRLSALLDKLLTGKVTTSAEPEPDADDGAEDQSGRVRQPESVSANPIEEPSNMAVPDEAKTSSVMDTEQINREIDNPQIVE